jgi:hypothetical protein
MFEIWERMEWNDGTLADWHQRGNDYSSIEAARELIAVLPVVIPYSMIGPGIMTYRIRQAITIREWLE